MTENGTHTGTDAGTDSGTDSGTATGTATGTGAGTRIRVLIADDQPLVRRGLSLILSPEPSFEVVGEAENGAQAVNLARQLRPDVVVMDIRMPVLDGVGATAELAATVPGCRVLALSTFDLDEYVVGALRAGASGFLPKDSSPEDLSAAIRTVHAGEAAVAPRLLTRLISTYVRASRGPRPNPAGAMGTTGTGELTPREIEVWRLMATGHDNAGISGALDISLSTVKNHITSIFDKLAVRDRAQAVIAAYESGLVTAGGAV
ncbi:response regulator [Streptomyces sp. NPDC059456]|uniref:response regulator n=1 Tax=Streptomyces sp. NPDC059456 TaxID=3346838 RepID=UPI0036C986C6